MISSIVARPDPSCALSRKSRSRPVDPQRLRSAARAPSPSFGSLAGCFSSSSRWFAIGHLLSAGAGEALGPLEGLFVAAVDLVPVDDVPEGLDVFGPAVLVLQVVGVLPDVEAEDRGVAADEGRVLVRQAVEHEPLVDADQPRPAAAEVVQGHGVELALELLEGAEGVLDRLANGSARLAA